MELHGRKHPRKPDWMLFFCESCKETFWSPERGKVYCDGCNPERPVRIIKARPGLSVDRLYHGGQFNKGEW